ncbi:RluA family pseudouridine synthase, partial [Patescibacteria group bacterium]|nr:RluA family pseudouridine synthase [Patescibacteria group bacterium]
PHFLVNDEMEISYDPSFLEKQTEKTGEIQNLNIIFEDEDVIVINKPSGLLVHETDTSSEHTLVDNLVNYLPSIASVGDDPKRPGIVHRLDKAASGVLIVAKNQAAFEHLKNQFKEKLTEKYYTVLVEGQMSKDHDTITLPISRSKIHGRMAAKPESQGGKVAITHYDVKTAYPHHTLLDVKIDTGRTHQIRAHMFAIGNPVVGDTLYRQKGMKIMDIGRLFLHASRLVITLPSGVKETFEAPLPEKLQIVLDSIPKI